MRYFLGLGSNLGDRAKQLRRAIAALGDRGISVLRSSGIYETEPVGGPPGQPAYLNQVLEAESGLDPRPLLEVLLEIERELGRDRPGEAVRWGARPIDIDILFTPELVIDEPDLKIPHPMLPERAFVLVPLADLAPDAQVPGMGTVREMLGRLPGTHGIRPARA